MHSQKENQEISVLGRLVSMEALVLFMGLASVVYGILTRDVMDVIIGLLLVAVIALVFCKYRQMKTK